LISYYYRDTTHNKMRKTVWTAQWN